MSLYLLLNFSVDWDSKLKKKTIYNRSYQHFNNWIIKYFNNNQI